MSLDVSKDCFPTPTRCHNCARKRTHEVKKETDPWKEFKRCANCHLMTYCDKDCQKEHWIRVHKKHCKFLSGQVHVNGSKHDAANCAQCIEQNQARPNQLRSQNSPKTLCSIDEVCIGMKQLLNSFFEFHEEGKKCNCSLDSALQLPFPLGEVSGQYLEIINTGLDALLAHALKILAAMTFKAEKEDDKNVLIQLWKTIVCERSQLWCDIIVIGIPFARSRNDLLEQVNGLQTIYGASNPWWKTIKFTVDFIMNRNVSLRSNFLDSTSLKDPRFQTMKIVNDYRQSQLQNQALACEKTLSNFLLWPELLNGSLAVLLPPGTRCQNCYDELYGEVSVTPRETNFQTRPSLLSAVGDNGALMACCPVAKDPNCTRNCVSIDAKLRMDEDQLKTVSKEQELFLIESRECDFCLKSSLSSHRCSACLTVQYCSTVCQKDDLDFHNTVCETWAKDKPRRILDKKKQKAHWKSTFAASGEH